MAEYLGFHLPDDIGDEQDGWPYPGFCSLCKRQRVRTYVMYDRRRACSDCVGDTARRVRPRSYSRAAIPERPTEKVGSGPPVPAMFGGIGL